MHWWFYVKLSVRCRVGTLMLSIVNLILYFHDLHLQRIYTPNCRLITISYFLNFGMSAIFCFTSIVTMFAFSFFNCYFVKVISNFIFPKIRYWKCYEFDYNLDWVYCQYISCYSLWKCVVSFRCTGELLSHFEDLHAAI